MIFANIEYLFLLLLLIPYIVWYVMQHRKAEPAMQVSTTWMYAKAPKSWKIYLRHAPFVLRTAAFVMIVLVLARPNKFTQSGTGFYSAGNPAQELAPRAGVEGA